MLLHSSLPYNSYVWNSVHSIVFMAHILLFIQMPLSVLCMYYFLKARKSVIGCVNEQITEQLQ